MSGGHTNDRPQLKRPSQARSIATFANILRASSEIIIERGVQGLNTNVVAERAGVNIGTVYHYFPDKTAILVELFRLDQERQSAPVMQKLREIADAPDLDQWTNDVVDLAMRLRNEDPATAQLRRAFRAVPELVDIDREETDKYLDFISSLLRVRFVGITKERARAATRLLINLTTTILDEAQALGDQSAAYFDEGRVALQCYLHSLQTI
jgi:AcrR family transcriptional regulator